MLLALGFLAAIENDIVTSCLVGLRVASSAQHNVYLGACARALAIPRVSPSSLSSAVAATLVVPHDSSAAVTHNYSECYLVGIAGSCCCCCNFVTKRLCAVLYFVVVRDIVSTSHWAIKVVADLLFFLFRIALLIAVKNSLFVQWTLFNTSCVANRCC